jgi:hypothetical protein
MIQKKEKKKKKTVLLKTSLQLGKPSRTLTLYGTGFFFFGYEVMEGLTLIGVFMEGTTLTCSARNSDARKNNPGMAYSSNEKPQLGSNSNEPM